LQHRRHSDDDFSAGPHRSTRSQRTSTLISLDNIVGGETLDGLMQRLMTEQVETTTSPSECVCMRAFLSSQNARKPKFECFGRLRKTGIFVEGTHAVQILVVWTRLTPVHATGCPGFSVGQGRAGLHAASGVFPLPESPFFPCTQALKTCPHMGSANLFDVIKGALRGI
jgi:hypothetical protein